MSVNLYGQREILCELVLCCCQPCTSNNLSPHNFFPCSSICVWHQQMAVYSSTLKNVIPITCHVEYYVPTYMYHVEYYVLYRRTSFVNEYTSLDGLRGISEGKTATEIVMQLPCDTNLLLTWVNGKSFSFLFSFHFLKNTFIRTS